MRLPGTVPWPAGAAERYRAAGYWAGRPLGELLRASARRYPRHTALVAGGQRMSYSDLDTRADRLAAGLHRLGIRPGDRLVVQLPNVPEFVLLCFALLRLGAIPVLALPPHRRREIGELCRLSAATGYVIPDRHAGFDHRALARQVRAEAPTVRHVLVAGAPDEFTSLSDVDAEPVPLPAPDPAEVALFLLSGGTTGTPKLIPRSHDDYSYNALASAELCGLTAGSVYLVALPAAHNFPLACPGLLGTLAVGGTVVLAPDADPAQAFPLIEAERVTVTALVPPVAALWLEATGWEPADLSSLRLLQVGGARLAPALARRIPAELGCALQQVYGMAEGLLNYTRLDDPPELVETSQGYPLSPADELRVVDGTGREVPAGETGELLTRGPYTPRGYYQAPEHNGRAFTPDGFYRTGDLVRRLPSGHLVVAGRVKDLINRCGDKVSAEEVEDELLAHPGVRAVALVALPDPVLGERGCAVLVPHGEPPTLAELRQFLTDRGLAAYKLPDLRKVVDSLPLTNVGKVHKARLAADLTGPEPPTVEVDQ